MELSNLLFWALKVIEFFFTNLNDIFKSKPSLNINMWSIYILFIFRPSSTVLVWPAGWAGHRSMADKIVDHINLVTAQWSNLNALYTSDICMLESIIDLNFSLGIQTQMEILLLLTSEATPSTTQFFKRFGWFLT